MNKSDLRKKAKEIRKTLDIEKISAEIILKIEKMQEFQQGGNILLFYPKEFEINLIFLCEKYNKKKKFYLPKVCGENLLVCPYECGLPLEVSDFGIHEPCSSPVSPEVIDFAIIPCLCADKQGYRIGYGGGFYDRFVPSLKKSCTKIIPVANELLFDKIPTEAHDIPVNFVITQKCTIRL